MNVAGDKQGPRPANSGGIRPQGSDLAKHDTA